MNRTEYADSLITRLRRHFDLEYKQTIDGVYFDIVGKYHQRNASYLINKDLEIYAFSNNEYLFYKDYDRAINADDIEKFYDFIRSNAGILIDRDEEHMESVITILIACDFPLDEETRKAIKKFKFHKSFKFGFEGWVNGKIIVLDPFAGEYYSNKYGRRIERNYIPQKTV